MKRIAILLGAVGMMLMGCDASASIPERVKATFVNYDNSVLYVTSLAYDGTAVYQGDTPTRPTSSESHHYVFSGWDQSLEHIKIDTTFIAQYTEEINTYTVEFKNYDDSLLQSTEVHHGEDVVYSAETPIREATKQFTYVFDGWDKPLTNITSSQVIHAQYIETVNQYTVTFQNDDGTVLGTTTVDYGGTAVYAGSTPTKESTNSHHFEFVGWDISLENIQDDCVAVAQYKSEINQYTVRFLNYDNSELAVVTVDYDGTAVYVGEDPVKPSTPQYSYAFNGWDLPLDHVTADLEVVAQFTESINQYTVTFYNDDGTRLGDCVVDYGGTAVYEGPDPEKENTAQYSYTFTGWDKSLNNITEDCDRHAVFTSSINSYTVTFKNYDGSVLSEETVQYGDDVVYHGETPTREKTAQYTYTFTGWDGSLEGIVCDTTLTAQYDETINQYTVTFKDYDGTVLYTDTVDYGGDATYQGEDPERERTAQYTYVFTGWDVELTNIQEDVIATAQYEFTTNQYTVTFKDYDDSVLAETTVFYGETASYEGDLPSRASTQQYTYSFSGWDISLENIQGDCVATAQYTETVNQYTVTFKDYDGTILDTQTVEYGSSATYGGELVSRPATAEYTYTFTGWDISLTEITDNCVATAQYSATKNQYTVTFKNYDGTILDTCTVEYGSEATYSGETPTKDATDQYTYTFSGWNISLDRITENCIATAQFSSTTNQYTITFKNYDNSLLGSCTVAYGSDGYYNGATPTRPNDAQYTYTFSGWSISLENVTSDRVAVAQYNYTVNQYTVTFKNYDGTILGTSTVDYGSTAAYSGSAPTKPENQQYSYAFTGWSISLENITGDCVAIAQFSENVKQYSVTFKNYDGTVLQVVTVDYGSPASYTNAEPTKPANQQYTYTFSGWDIKLDNIISDCIATAQYNSTVNQYTVTFKNYDGSILSTSTVDYGSAASYTGATPTKAATAQYSYVFSGWSASINNITEDCVVFATFQEVTNKYTVTFKNYDGTILDTSTVDYGSAATYTGATPTRAKTQQYSYSFNGWDISLESIKSDCVAVAQYISTLNQYTVTFKNYDGSVLGTSTVEYGSNANYGGNTPVKPATAQYSYSFIGWDKTLNNVTDDYEVVAQYESTINKYTVTFKNYDGSVLGTCTVDYGEDATYTGYTPTRSSSAQYDYSFSGWDIALENITENKVAFAQYDSTIRSYSVVWKNYDGTVLETDNNVNYGTTPTYNGATPTKADDADHFYTFSGWSPSVESVTGNAVYVAQFNTGNFYTVQWVSYGSESVIYQAKAKDGAVLPVYNNGENYPNEITESGAKYFEGWIICDDTHYYSFPIHFVDGVAYYGAFEDSPTYDWEDNLVEGPVVVQGDYRVIPMSHNFDYDLRFTLNSAGTGYIVSAGSTFRNMGGEIYIPDTYNDLPVVEIGDNAFKDTLDGFDPTAWVGTPSIFVSLPDTITRIGDHAFENSPLGHIEIRGNSQLTYIGENAFAGCIYARSDSYYDGFLTAYALTTVQPGAFAGCELLTYIWLPNTLESFSFSGDTFAGCPNLTMIRYTGTKAEWLAICPETEIETDYEPSEFVVRCTDGDITIHYI